MGNEWRCRYSGINRRCQKEPSESCRKCIKRTRRPHGKFAVDCARVHGQHPDYTAAQIARVLGSKVLSHNVRSTLRRYGIELPYEGPESSRKRARDSSKG